MKTTSVKSILSVAFIISGACGLIYQIVWFKYLALTLGSTTYAQMIVLSAFLGGIALGNHFLGRLADRSRNPVRLYALLELLIGFYCLFYPWIYQVAGDGFRAVVLTTDLYGHNLAFNLLRLFVSGLLMLIPTIAMGGTLPSLSRFFVQSEETSHSDTAILYFLNSFGAVVGVYFAGFQMIEAFGLQMTMVLTAVVNLLVGSAVFLVAKNPDPTETLSVRDSAAGLPDPGPGDRGILRAAVAIAGISGFAALLYEVLWFRLLVNLIGSSTYSFSLMLGAFITGIAAGSLLVSQRWLVRVNKLRLLIVCQAGIAVGTMIVLPVFSVLPYYLWKLASVFNLASGIFSLFLVLEFALCFMLMLVPTVFMGMGLPLVVGIVCRDKRAVGRAVGTVFSVNTAGTVAGVIVTSAVLIPLCGIQRSFEVGIALNLLSGMIGVSVLPGPTSVRKLVLVASLVVVAILPEVVTPSWDARVISSGSYRWLTQKPPETLPAFLRELEQRQLLYYREGVNANVAVIRYPGDMRVLAINGKPDASTGGDMPTQMLVGHIPLFLHQNPHSVFVVGYGSGATIGAVLSHGVDSVVCVEIQREVIDASQYFGDVNADCLADPRLRVVIDDAHTYLGLVPRTYDVIISEPSNPWLAGVGNLFSREYFELCRRKLNHGGIMAQWLQTYEADDAVVRMVLNTFQSVFPYCQVWAPRLGDLVLIGSDHDITINPGRVDSLVALPPIHTSLDRVSIHTGFTLLGVQALTSEGVFCLTDSLMINSETHPLLEFQAPRSYFIHNWSTLVENADQRANLPDDALLIQKYLNGRPPNHEEVKDALSYFYSIAGNVNLSHALSRYALERWGADFVARHREIRTAEALGLDRGTTEALQDLHRRNPDSTYLVSEYIDHEWKAIRAARSFLKRFPADPVIREMEILGGGVGHLTPATEARIAEIYFEDGDLNAADSVCNRLLQNTSPGDLMKADWAGRTLYIAGTISAFQGNVVRGIRMANELQRIRPDDGMTRELVRRVVWRLREEMKGK